jgi:uncharacterized protein YjbI with pentapeptide repeats
MQASRVGSSVLLKERRVERLVTVGLIIALVMTFSGVALAGNSPPSSIETCTKVNHHGIYGKTKVFTGSPLCKGALQTWVPSAYKQIFVDADQGQGIASMDYSGVDFSNMELPDLGVHSGDFSRANFTGAILSATETSLFSGWEFDNFTDATFSGTVMAFGNFYHSTFDHTDLSGEDLRDTDLSSASFVGTTLTGTSFYEANLYGATGLDGDNTSSVLWSNTTCPDDTNSDTDGGTCAGHLTL